MYSNNQFYSLWKIYFLQCTLIIYPIFLCAVFSLFRLYSVLFKASEKIRTLMIEDCEWCDVEILDVQPIPTEKTWLTRAEDPSCSFITLPSCHLTTDVWLATDLTNFTYMSSVQQDLPSEELQTEATNQESEISGFSSDYVTSVAT